MSASPANLGARDARRVAPARRDPRGPSGGRAAGGDDGRFGLPSVPRRRRACTRGALAPGPGLEGTFDQYVINSGNGIHRSAVLAWRGIGAPFTFGDAAFLVRWLEREGHEHRRGLRLLPTPSRARDLCGTTWLELFRSLVRDGRVDVVGGGWVPRRGCHARSPLAPARLSGAAALKPSSRDDGGGRRWRGRSTRSGTRRPPRRYSRTWGTGTRGEQGAEGRQAGGVCAGQREVRLVPRGVERGKSSLTCSGGTITCRARWTSRRAHGRELGRRRRRARGGGGGVVRGTGAGAGRAMMLVGGDFQVQRRGEDVRGVGDVLARVGSGNREERSRRRRETRGPEGREEERVQVRVVRRRCCRRALQTRMSYPRSGSFLPYADNWPVSENAWVGSFVRRRELKRAVVASSTAALNAFSRRSVPERSKTVASVATSEGRERREPRTWVCTTTPSRARAQSRWRTTSLVGA